MPQLSVNAKEFNPSWAQQIPATNEWEEILPADPFDFSSEFQVSPEELQELEDVDDWVSMMADLDEAEHEHLIAIAVRYADKGTVQNLMRNAQKGKKSISTGSSPRSQ